MIKQWLTDVERVENVEQENKIRLHSCERLQPFPVELSSLLSDDDFMYYQDTNKLKRKLAKLHGVNVDNIFISPGSDITIKTFLDLFEENTQVWTTRKYFPMYKVYAELNNHSFHTATFPTKKPVAILSSPNSPLGTHYTTEALTYAATHNGYLLIDEAYIDYDSNPADTMSIIREHKNVVVSRTFSKGLGGAGCRIGYAIADEGMISLMNKFRSMFELSGPSIKFAEYVLDNYDAVKEYCANTIAQRSKIRGLFEERGYSTFSAEGNWIYVEQTDKLVTHLEQFAIIRKDCNLFRDDKWIRLTIGAGLLDYDFIQSIPTND